MSDRSMLSVLVVEDNPADSRLIVEELADQPDPVAVETSGSIESALDLLANRRFDCVLVCHDLLAAHEADGLAAFGAAAAPAPVIVLVEYSDTEVMLSTLQAGADDCYRKAGLKGGDLLWSMRLSIARRNGNTVGTAAESDLDQFTRVVGPVFDALPVAIAAVDPEGAVVLWNQTSEELFGWSADEVVGSPLPTISDREAVEEFEKALGTHATLAERETLRRRKDGSIVPVAVTTAPIFLGGNTPLGMIGLAIDISDRIRVLTDLRESEQRFRSVFEHSNDAIFVLDPERDEFLEVNAKAAELLGYPQDELVRLRPSDIHPDEMPQLAAFAEAVFESGHGWTNELTCTTRAGDRLASEISASVISLGGRSWMIATMRDLSAFRRTQDQLSEARDAVRAREAQLDRAATELSEFARAVSHDLSEPLRTVSSYVQLLDRRYHDSLDQDAAEFIDFTVEAVTRMRDLIKDLLAFARIGAGGREPADVDTAEVVGDVINDLAAAIDSAQATIETADLPVVRGDEIELRALFQNLIGNALKFRSPNRSPLIRIESKATADGTEFAVIDNGIGIEPGRQDQVFEVFRRMHSRDEYPGTGIGLAICRKIVTRHGGHLWLESTPDVGTTFFIVLPNGANPSTD